MTDDQRIEWFERNHTLHRAVEILYIVDGFIVSLTYDGNPQHQFQADTLREAIDLAMTVWP